MSTRPLARLAASIVAVLLLGACARGPSSASSAPPTLPRRAADFRLLDQFGTERRLSDFRGKVVLLTFVSSRCTTACPLTAELLRRTQADLGDGAGRVQLVAVNTEYRFVAPADVLSWSAQHSMTHRWEFLTGTFVDLSRVWRAYGITGGSAHTTAVFVIDPRGWIRTVLPIAMGKAIGAEAKALQRYVAGLEA